MMNKPIETCRYRFCFSLYLILLSTCPLLVTAQPTDSDTTINDPIAQGAEGRSVNRSPAELRAIQRDVRALRDDVRRLSELIGSPTATGTEAATPFTVQANPTSSTKVDPSQTEIQLALGKLVSLECTDVPLIKVIREIKGMIDVNVVVDEGALAEEGVSIKAPINIVLSGISARSALKLILEPLQLTFIEDDEVLKITNRVRAKGELIVATYAIDDLVRVLAQDAMTTTTNAKSPKENRVEELKAVSELITKTISPDSWDVAGGRGTIQLFGVTDSLVIRQTNDVHIEIGELLEQIRRLHRLPQRIGKDHDSSMLLTAVYFVADLITPMPDAPGARTKVIATDWLKLVDRITTDVEPKQWAVNGGPCSIHAFDQNPSLAIRATQSMHESIANLLSGMRKGMDTQVTVAISFLSFADDAVLKKAGLEFDSQTGICELKAPQVKQLMISAKQESWGNLHSPKITMFNGQIVCLTNDRAESGDQSEQCQLHFRGNVTEDRRSVRLSIAYNSKNLVNDLINSAHRVEDGGYLLMDVTDRTAAIAQSPALDVKSYRTLDSNDLSQPDPSKTAKVRRLMLVQPRIILQQEDEEILHPLRPLPPSKADVN